MQVRRDSQGTFLITLKPGEQLRHCLEKACLDWDIPSGAVSGIGGLCQVELGYWRASQADYQRKTLAGSFELLTLLGNISLYQGRPFAHLHVTLADENLQVVGGHFFEATVTATAELFLTPCDLIERHWDAHIGAALWKLNPG